MSRTLNINTGKFYELRAQLALERDLLKGEVRGREEDSHGPAFLPCNAFS